MDMDTSYAKFGIKTAQHFDTTVNDENESFGPPSIHIHDIGHNIKTAEASFERSRIGMGVFPMILVNWQ